MTDGGAMKSAFDEACKRYAEARHDFNMSPKEKNALYAECMEAGKALGMSQYEIVEVIDKRVEESYFEK